MQEEEESTASGAVAPPTVPPAPSVSPDRVLAGPPLEGEGQHPGATSSEDPRPPGLEPPPGVSTDDSAPRERPEGSLQKPKGPTAPMLKMHSRLRNPADLLKWHLKHYHMTCHAQS